jgi:hypothetical protein
VLSASGGGWQPGTALEQSPQHPKRAQACLPGSARMTGMKALAALASAFMRRLWCRSGAYRGSAAARSPFTGGRAGFRHHLLEAFGVGLPLAVLLDATLIRGALLPAAMRLDGRATWWAPGPLHWLHARSGLREPTEHTPAPGPCAVRMGPSRRPGQRTMARRAAFGWLGRRRRVGQGIRHELGGHGGSTGRPGHTGSPYVAPADRLIPVTPHRRRYASLAAQPAATPVTVATEPPLGRRCLAPDPRPSRGHSGHGNGGET